MAHSLSAVFRSKTARNWRGMLRPLQSNFRQDGRSPEFNSSTVDVGKCSDNGGADSDVGRLQSRLRSSRRHARCAASACKRLRVTPRVRLISATAALRHAWRGLTRALPICFRRLRPSIPPGVASKGHRNSTGSSPGVVPQPDNSGRCLTLIARRIGIVPACGRSAVVWRGCCADGGSSDRGSSNGCGAYAGAPIAPPIRATTDCYGATAHRSAAHSYGSAAHRYGATTMHGAAAHGYRAAAPRRPGIARNTRKPQDGGQGNGKGESITSGFCAHVLHPRFRTAPPLSVMAIRRRLSSTMWACIVYGRIVGFLFGFQICTSV